MSTSAGISCCRAAHGPGLAGECTTEHGEFPPLGGSSGLGMRGSTVPAGEERESCGGTGGSPWIPMVTSLPKTVLRAASWRLHEIKLRLPFPGGLRMKTWKLKLLLAHIVAYVGSTRQVFLWQRWSWKTSLRSARILAQDSSS